MNEENIQNLREDEDNLTSKAMVLFGSQEFRRKWHDNRLFFAINDVIFSLTESVNVVDYIKKMRIRDEELNKGWGQIVTPLVIQTAGGPPKDELC